MRHPPLTLLHRMLALPMVTKRFLRDERGVSMVEYVLLIALIALVVSIGGQAMGLNMNRVVQGLAAYLATVPTNP